ncbi:MAG: neuromedin U [Planctomycetota bacterium]
MLSARGRSGSSSIGFWTTRSNVGPTLARLHQRGDVDEGDLARAAQNPIADLISLPFQNNTNIDFGNLNYEQNVLNIQPVIPINLNEDWNLVTRTIVPLIYQPAAFSGDDHDFGLGDIQFTPFFVPTRTFGGWMLGAGPVMRAPTATDERLGARKWALGPSAVAILSEFLWQPFINYNIPEGKGWYLTTSPIITANWMADSDDTWTIPLGGGVGRVFNIGKQPVNVSLQGFYNVEKPSVVGDWTIRFQFQFLFPR